MNPMCVGLDIIYMRARYYDPATGQFISRDPLEASTRQPYSYANDNPLNATDPSGLDFIDDVGSFVGRHWRPIASVAPDAGTIAVCAGTVGTVCGAAIAANLAAQTALIATGPGSTAEKIGLVGINTILAGASAVGAQAVASQAEQSYYMGATRPRAG